MERTTVSTRRHVFCVALGQKGETTPFFLFSHRTFRTPLIGAAQFSPNVASETTDVRFGEQTLQSLRPWRSGDNLEAGNAS